MDILRGTRVLSFNHFLMGPAGAQILGDLGADVIAVEPTTGAHQRNWAGGDLFVDGQSALFLCANRNKRSLAIDLKAPEGSAIIRKLISRSDVVMENFRPGVLDKLGFGYEAVTALNPRIVYASATGYGPDGPYRDNPGQDLLVQAISGIAASTGSADGDPHPVGTSVVDHHGAALLALGVLGGLLARDRTGQPQRVEVSLLSAALDLQNEPLTLYLNGLRTESARGPGNVAGWYFPAPYGIYPTSDGFIALSLVDLATLAGTIECSELASFAPDDAFQRRSEISALVRKALQRKTTAHWLRRLASDGVWHAEVNDFAGVIEDPQVRHNEAFVTMPGATGSPISLLKHPVRYNREAPEIRLVPQPLGAQTEEILRELGYAPPDIDRLSAEGVILRSPTDCE